MHLDPIHVMYTHTHTHSCMYTQYLAKTLALNCKLSLIIIYKNILMDIYIHIILIFHIPNLCYQQTSTIILKILAYFCYKHKNMIIASNFAEFQVYKVELADQKIQWILHKKKFNSTRLKNEPKNILIIMSMLSE